MNKLIIFACFVFNFTSLFAQLDKSKNSTYKYYKNPQKTDRSTKNFDNLAEANLRMIDDGNVGTVLTVKGEVKRCHYCAAFTVCKQKDAYLADGTLQLPD